VNYCGTGLLDGDTFTCNENRVLFVRRARRARGQRAREAIDSAEPPRIARRPSHVRLAPAL